MDDKFVSDYQIPSDYTKENKKMLGGILKLALSFSALFLLVTLTWQASIADALPTLAADDSLVKSNEDQSRLFASNHHHKGASVVKRSLHSTVDQHSLIDLSPSASSSSSSSARQRHLKKISHSKSLKSSPNLFQSTGTYKKNLRAAKRFQAVLDNRLKRFRMLDQDEFQEMLKSLSQQTAEEQSKAANGMDTIGGMELANYWSPI